MSLPAFMLQIPNHHCEECGTPPVIDCMNESRNYVGYFENFYGEQFILTLDRATKKATLQGGDLGWDKKYDVKVVDSRASVPELILETEVRLWLTACIMQFVD